VKGALKVVLGIVTSVAGFLEVGSMGAEAVRDTRPNARGPMESAGPQQPRTAAAYVFAG
jgi:hypothetical protein